MRFFHRAVAPKNQEQSTTEKIPADSGKVQGKRPASLALAGCLK
jgi:hypothetical protein